MELFDLELPKNNEPKEKVEITTTILYLSKEELKEFKLLTKEGMKKMYPETFKEENFSDFLLTILRKYNENTEH